MKNSLNGLRILNTRPQAQAKPLSQQIHEAGGLAIDFPTIEIKEYNPQWVREIPSLDLIDFAIYISANAAQFCFQSLAKHEIHWPNSIKTIAIGQGTANALVQQGIPPDYLAAAPDSESLVTLPCLDQIQQKKVLLFTGHGGRTVIEQTLQQRNAALQVVAVYERTMPKVAASFVNSLWHNDAVDIILLTSEQSMHHLFKLFNPEAHRWLQSKPWLVISNRLAQSASLLGIKKITICHPNRIIDSLFDSGR